MGEWVVRVRLQTGERLSFRWRIEVEWRSTLVCRNIVLSNRLFVIADSICKVSNLQRVHQLYQAQNHKKNIAEMETGWDSDFLYFPTYVVSELDKCKGNGT
jgi:hypothetical protein